jgi:hypothetical protein
VWEYRARSLKVLDGDTVRLLVDLGFYTFRRIDLRLLEVGAPELHEPGGVETRDYVEQWIHDAGAGLDWPLLIRTQITKLVEPTERQSFTRYIGDILDHLDVFDRDGRHLNADLRAYLAEHPEWGPGS